MSVVEIDGYVSAEALAQALRLTRRVKRRDLGNKALARVTDRLIAGIEKASTPAECERVMRRYRTASWRVRQQYPETFDE